MNTRRKIVVLRGYMASGKSTTLANLKLRKKMRDWIFIDFEKIREMFNNNEKTRIEYADRAFFAILKEMIKTKRNIITQETSEEMLRKNIGSEIKKYKYQIEVIALTISPETSYLRVAERRRARGIKPRPRKEVYESHKNRQETLSKEKVFINTENLTKEQVVDAVLKLIFKK